MSSKARPDTGFISTRDGWRLACYRYTPPSKRAYSEPVLLVHGLGANRFNLDAPFPNTSLAEYLRLRGWDVWVIELRGAGRSRQPGWPLRGKPQFDFDDYVHRDAPAVIRHLLDATGAEALHWVGHSMGGMLAYAALMHFDQQLFRSVVTVASPAFTATRHPRVDTMVRFRQLLRWVRWVPYRRAGQVASLWPPYLHRLVGDVAANPDQMDRAQLTVMARWTLTDLPAALLEQFSEWYDSKGGFSRYDGLLDYYDHLDRICAPMLLIAGATDQLSPVEDVRYVYEAISSTHKELLVCGRETGCAHDYKHIDLILGSRAQLEVYPHIARWIEGCAIFGERVA